MTAELADLGDELPRLERVASMPAAQGKATADRKLRVLFTLSHTDFSPTAAVHGLLMRHFDPERVEVHVACVGDEPGRRSESMTALTAIPDVRIRPTRFGPTVYRKSKAEV